MLARLPTAQVPTADEPVGGGVSADSFARHEDGGNGGHREGAMPAGRRDCTQVTGGESAEGREARDVPRLAGDRVEGGSAARRAPHGRRGSGCG